jgi:hypothetical protein
MSECEYGEVGRMIRDYTEDWQALKKITECESCNRDARIVSKLIVKTLIDENDGIHLVHDRIQS